MVCARSPGSCGQHCVEKRRIFRHLVTFPSLELSLCGRLRRQIGLGNCVGSWYAASAVLMVTFIARLPRDSCSKQSNQASRRKSFQFGRSQGNVVVFLHRKKEQRQESFELMNSKNEEWPSGRLFF